MCYEESIHYGGQIRYEDCLRICRDLDLQDTTETFDSRVAYDHLSEVARGFNIEMRSFSDGKENFMECITTLHTLMVGNLTAKNVHSYDSIRGMSRAEFIKDLVDAMQGRVRRENEYYDILQNPVLRTSVTVEMLVWYQDLFFIQGLDYLKLGHMLPMLCAKYLDDYSIVDEH